MRCLLPITWFTFTSPRRLICYGGRYKRIGIPKLLSQLLRIRIDTDQPAFHTEAQDLRGENPSEEKDRASKPSCSKATTEGVHPIVTECHFKFKHPVTYRCLDQRLAKGPIVINPLITLEIPSYCVP